MIEEYKFINLIPIKYSNIVRITFRYNYSIGVATEGLSDNETIDMQSTHSVDIPVEQYVEYNDTVDSNRWLCNFIGNNWEDILSTDDGDISGLYITDIVEEIYFNSNGETFLIEQNPFPSQN